MKNKLLVFLIAFLVLIVPFQSAEAVKNQLPQDSLDKLLNIVKGDWYDNTGNKVLSIYDGYLNGCKVVAGFDWAGSRGNGGAVLRIMEETGLRDIRIGWYVSRGVSHFVTLNRGGMLHNTPQVPFFESIEGIHLGMSVDEVIRKWGNPRILSPMNPYTANGETFKNGWYYPDKGVLVICDKTDVRAIRLLKESNLHFSRSGLNCKNTIQDFVQAYSMKRVPQLPKNIGKGEGTISPIGNGEAISFGYNMNYVELGLEMY